MSLSGTQILAKNAHKETVTFSSSYQLVAEKVTQTHSEHNNTAMLSVIFSYLMHQGQKFIEITFPPSSCSVFFILAHTKSQFPFLSHKC